MTLESIYKSFIKSPHHKLALPLSFVYETVLRLRKKFLKRPKKDESIFVVSVGNLDFGGTGKTPTVLHLLDTLNNRSIGVLTRGYKSELEHQGSFLANDLKGEKLADIIGDEPAMILKAFPKIPIFVGKFRDQGLEKAKKLGLKTVLLEDGAQYRKIQKDLEVVLLDAEDPIKPLFPSGYRRDTLDVLKNADLVLFPYTASQVQYEHAKEKIRHLTKAPCAGFEASLSFEGLPQKLALFTAIARPERLLQALQQKGFDLVATKIEDDHAKPEVLSIDTFILKAKEAGAQAFVCTEKDWVKLSKTHQNIFFPIKLFLKPLYEASNWERFIGKIEKMS